MRGERMPGVVEVPVPELGLGEGRIPGPPRGAAHRRGAAGWKGLSDRSTLRDHRIRPERRSDGASTRRRSPRARLRPRPESRHRAPERVGKARAPARAGAVELVKIPVDLILVSGPGQARAAKQATATIPIVFGALPADPVRAGLVASLARPGGNVTGTTALSSQLSGKRLELLKETLPHLMMLHHGHARSPRRATPRRGAAGRAHPPDRSPYGAGRKRSQHPEQPPGSSSGASGPGLARR